MKVEELAKLAVEDVACAGSGRVKPAALSEQCFTFDCADVVGEVAGDAMTKLHDAYDMRNFVGFADAERRTIVCHYGNVTVRFFVLDGVITQIKTEQTAK